MAVRHIKDRALVMQAVYNRPDVRERAAQIYQETLSLSVDDMMDLAIMRYHTFGVWEAAHSLAVLIRLKPTAQRGHEVFA